MRQFGSFPGLKPACPCCVSRNPAHIPFYGPFYGLECRFRGREPADHSIRLKCSLSPKEAFLSTCYGRDIVTL